MRQTVESKNALTHTDCWPGDKSPLEAAGTSLVTAVHPDLVLSYAQRCQQSRPETRKNLDLQNLVHASVRAVPSSTLKHKS